MQTYVLPRKKEITIPILNNYICYRLYAQHRKTNQIVEGCIADTVEELSYSVPIYGNGKDRALQHSDIKNPDNWDVIVMALCRKTGRWIEVEDPRIWYEDL